MSRSVVNGRVVLDDPGAGEMLNQRIPGAFLSGREAGLAPVIPLSPNVWSRYVIGNSLVKVVGFCCSGAL